MNTNDIFEKCRELDGVRVETEENCTRLLLESAEGRGRMCFYPVFRGISLAVISVRAPYWPAPIPENCTPEENGPLIINYCLRGRCELVLNDNKSVFLSSDMISLTEKFARCEYTYPGRVYDGVEIFIDPEALAENTDISGSFGVDIASLREKYCGGGETYIAKTTLSDSIISRLTGEGGTVTERVGRMTGVVDLIACLLDSEPEKTADRFVYYTKSQVEIARKTEKIIMSDLSVQHTAAEFSQMFSVSESSIKNYFRGVFGQSISRYITRERMTEAARLISETNLSVLEVANRVGYENQSKFAAAFKRVHGVTPLEYRRTSSVDKHSEE